MYRQFQLMNNKVIKHDLENLLCCMGGLYRQLNQLATGFAFLAHLTSTFQCSTSSMDSPAMSTVAFYSIQQTGQICYGQ